MGAPARQGDFFLAEFIMSTGVMRPAPVFVIGTDNDPLDLVVCSCTSSPARGPFDIEVQLKIPTFVRTNKIYTIGRDQLHFKIDQKATPQQISQIVQAVRTLSSFLRIAADSGLRRLPLSPGAEEDIGRVIRN